MLGLQRHPAQSSMYHRSCPQTLLQCPSQRINLRRPPADRLFSLLRLCRSRGIGQPAQRYADVLAAGSHNVPRPVEASLSVRKVPSVPSRCTSSCWAVSLFKDYRLVSAGQFSLLAACLLGFGAEALSPRRGFVQTHSSLARRPGSNSPTRNLSSDTEAKEQPRCLE